ncbi:hypothetical protein BH24ACT21_BH24ACT21_06690 [soil metagenome]
MTGPQNSEARLRKLRLALSIAVILFGIFMMAATFTPFGPSPAIGLVVGGVLTAYGALRLYLALKN